MKLSDFKTHHYIGIVGASLVAYYFYKSMKEDENPAIDGFNVNVDADKIINSGLALAGVNPIASGLIKNVSKKVLSGFMKR